MKISIIMPLYNAGWHLAECLDSVLEQTFTEFELLCVNDCSSDSTLEILRSYCMRDSRIRVLENAVHRGAAFSRNRGMREARGKYLAFLDGDDIFDESMFDKAYHKIEEYEADIVMYEFRHVPSDCIHRKIRVSHGREYLERYCQSVFSVLNYEGYEFVKWASGPWNKLYRRSFIEENQLEFQDLSCANDVYFVNMALMLAGKLTVLETESVMVYVRDHFDAGRISSDRDPMCIFEAFLKIGQELVKRGKFDRLCACFYYKLFFSLQSALLADKNKERVEQFYSFLQEEGMQKICSLDVKCYERLDSYIQTELARYRLESFASGWYKEKNILELYLHKRAAGVIGLFRKFEAAGLRTAIWGAGQNGRVLLEFCSAHKIQIDAVIDKSASRQGEILHGQRIDLPQDVLDIIQVIVISAVSIYENVMETVGERKIEVIDINHFVCID